MKLDQKNWLTREIVISKEARALINGFRYTVAAGMLGWFLVVSVTASMTSGSLAITRECIAPVWGFVLVMFPEALVEIRYLLRNKIIVYTVIVIFGCTVSWFLRGYDVHEPRLRFMLGVGLLFPAASGWFRQVGPKGMQLAFSIKLALLIFAFYKYGMTILQGLPPRDIFVRPPIYRHLRHFNYDLTLMCGLAGGIFPLRNWFLKVSILSLFFALGYFSFWTGGRGQFLALLVMALTALFTKRSHDDMRTVFLLIGAFLMGGIALIVSGETGFLLSSVERSARDSINAVSSGRLAIWMGTLQTGFSSPVGAFFGYGPESFERMGVFVQFRHYIVHPHNTVVQWIFEYGLLGAAGLICSALSLAWCCLMPALKFGGTIERVAAITLIGVSVFALVDGVFYHAAPLLFITVIWAYLFSRVTRQPSRVKEEQFL